MGPEPPRGGAAFQRWGRRVPAFQRLGRAGKEEGRGAGGGIPGLGAVPTPPINYPQLITVNQRRVEEEEEWKDAEKDQDEGEGKIKKEEEEDEEIGMRRKEKE